MKRNIQKKPVYQENFLIFFTKNMEMEKRMCYTDDARIM